jgi:hypothetical protein
MSGPVVERRSGRPPDGVDRRQRKQDPWRKVLNWLAYVVYPLLIINVFIFMAVAGEDQKGAVAAKMEQTAEQMGHTVTQGVSSWVHLNAFLPIMILGVGIGAIGIVLDRKRARRRSDYSLMTPMVLTVLSVVGMLIYFFARGLAA